MEYILFSLIKKLEIPNNNKKMTDITFVENANLPIFILFFKLEVIVVPKTAPIPALDNKIPNTWADTSPLDYNL